MSLRVAINGFGRIGRGFVRALIEAGCPEEIDLVAINDLASGETLVHLLKYDSTHGRLKTPVSLMSDTLCVEGLGSIALSQAQTPDQCPWQDLGVDLVLECTGVFRARRDAALHLSAGARRVIVGAAPFDSTDKAVVMGVNHMDVEPSHQILSSVSCTTQALVPLVKLLDDAYQIEHGFMTEIHAVTADQNVLDQPHRDLRRARASGFNIIPTTSSALGALERVLPHMQGRIEGLSLRVPTQNVAAIDLTVQVQAEVNTALVNALLEEAAQTQFAGIMAVTREPLVSSDHNHEPFSLNVDLLETRVLGKLVKVFAWYDNEWGYACRLIDLCRHLARTTA